MMTTVSDSIPSAPLMLSSQWLLCQMFVYVNQQSRNPDILNSKFENPNLLPTERMQDSSLRNCQHICQVHEAETAGAGLVAIFMWDYAFSPHLQADGSYGSSDARAAPVPDCFSCEFEFSPKGSRKTLMQPLSQTPKPSQPD